MRHLDVIEHMMGGRQLTRALGVRIGNYIAFRAAATAAGNQFRRER
jgi:hypothetical protein